MRPDTTEHRNEGSDDNTGSGVHRNTSIYAAAVAVSSGAFAKPVQILKGQSSRRLSIVRRSRHESLDAERKYTRDLSLSLSLSSVQEEFPDLRKRTGSAHVGAGYFCPRVGAVDEATIKAYIENQKWDEDD